MYFVLEWGPVGPGGVAYLDGLGNFGVHSQHGRRIEVTPDGLDYVLLRVNAQPSIAVNYADAPRITVDEQQLGTVWHFDARAGGELWAVGRKAVGHYSPASESWTVHPTADSVEADDGYAVGIEVDAGGKVWVANQRAVFSLSGDAFEAAALPEPASKHVALLRGADGGLYLHRVGDVLQLTDAGWVSAVAPTPPADGTLERVTVLADGSIVAFTTPDHQLVRTTKAGARQQLRLDDETEISALDVDTSSRVWVSTPIGIFVVAPELSSIERRYGVGSIDAFKPRDGGEGILQFVSVGPPMSLPDSTAPRGVIVGRLMHGGKPLADKSFQMCAHPARKARELGSMGSPCEMESDTARGGKTDAQGRFRATGIEAGGAYDFAMFVDGGEIAATDNYPCCEKMPDEGIFDMGDVVVR